MTRLDPNKLLFIVGTITIAAVGYFFFWLHHEIDVIVDVQDNRPTSPITGLPCESPERRPVAVMLASDPAARPLSGVAAADIVFEMPVTPNGVTRMMAVFQCEIPEEIGSIRSARLDFIPLAGSFAAIYAHWGGEKEALDKLNKGILDNIDALKYDGTVFYRKSGIRPPHNGFTDMDNLVEQAKKLKYSPLNIFSGYLHGEQPSRNIANIQSTVAIPYDGPYAVVWQYDGTTGTYLRSRNGTPEIDANTGTQVSAGVVIELKTRSKFIHDQYISVEITGQGSAIFHQKGIASGGTWQKDAAAPGERLAFYDGNGKEMAFVPGKIWVEIVTE